MRLYYGARTAELLVDAQRFADAGCELIATTDDGSAARAGSLPISSSERASPMKSMLADRSPMLRTVARIAAESGVRAQLSLEETFGCGVGGCWGCVVPLVRDERASAELSAGAGWAAATSSTRGSVKRGRSSGRDELRW